MRNQCKPGRRWYRAIALPLAIALLAACAGQMPPQPQRTYDHIAEPSLLYGAVVGALEGAGYGIAKREPARHEVQTTWKEGPGDARGSVRWRERRMYTAWAEVDSLHGRYNVFLELLVQERPAAGADWTAKPVVPQQDAEYLKVLQAIDLSVRRIGGVIY